MYVYVVPGWQEGKVDVLSGRPDDPLGEVETSSQLYGLRHSRTRQIFSAPACLLGIGEHREGGNGKGTDIFYSDQKNKITQ